jgi:hypothetical protein
MNGSIIPRATAPSKVKNKPFKAKWVCVLEREKEEVQEGMLYRDTLGRTRLEVHSSKGGDVIFIADRDRGELAIVEPAAREVRRGTLGKTSLSGWAFANAAPSYTDEYKIIHGIPCRRVVLRDPMTAADAGETWISDQHMLVMTDTGKVNGVQRDWRVLEIDLGEPAAELFVVPADYRVIQEGRD